MKFQKLLIQNLILGPVKEVYKHTAHKQTSFFKSISIGQKDNTTPITTIPTLDPIPSTTPLLNPTISNPNSPASTTTSPASSAIRSWCIASQSAPRTALQVALDYACGFGGVNCSAIQPSGGCYNPNMLRNHASYAFNNYYQKNPVPNSCTFGGTGVTTSTDPSKPSRLSLLVNTTLLLLNRNQYTHVLFVTFHMYLNILYAGSSTCRYPSTR